MNTLGPALAFVKKWVAQNVHPSSSGDVEAKGEELARTFLADAKAAGFDEAEIREAIDDDVADYMIEALEKVRGTETGQT
jgi:hypothetical protein